MPRPVQWNQVLNVFANFTGEEMKQRMFSLLQRPQSTVDAYFQWKQKALSVFDSVSSAILCEKLGYHAKEGSDGRYAAVPPPALSAPHFAASKNPVAGKPYFTDVDGEKVIVALLPNDFPYNIGKDVRHEVLWAERQLDATTIKRELDTLLGRRLYLWYENSVTRKSVPGVFHVQVLSKVEKDEYMNSEEELDEGEDDIFNY